MSFNYFSNKVNEKIMVACHTSANQYLISIASRAEINPLGWEYETILAEGCDQYEFAPLPINCVVRNWARIQDTLVNHLAPLGKSSLLQTSLSRNNLSSIRIFYNGMPSELIKFKCRKSR